MSARVVTNSIQNAKKYVVQCLSVSRYFTGPLSCLFFRSKTKFRGDCVAWVNDSARWSSNDPRLSLGVGVLRRKLFHSGLADEAGERESVLVPELLCGRACSVADRQLFRLVSDPPADDRDGGFGQRENGLRVAVDDCSGGRKIGVGMAVGAIVDPDVLLGAETHAEKIPGKK